MAVAGVAGVVSFIAGASATPEKTAPDEEAVETTAKPKQSRTIPAVTPAAAPRYNMVAEKLQGCKFLVNQGFKKKAKVYLFLFSASWCPPCRAEMPRIAKTYAETLKDDPDIELVHFSRDREESKALAWAKEHDVKFPVVRSDGGNPLDLHCNGIPHLFIVRDNGTLVEEGHPMRLFTEAVDGLPQMKRVRFAAESSQGGSNVQDGTKCPGTARRTPCTLGVVV